MSLRHTGLTRAAILFADATDTNAPRAIASHASAKEPRQAVFLDLAAVAHIRRSGDTTLRPSEGVDDVAALSRLADLVGRVDITDPPRQAPPPRGDGAVDQLT